MDLSKEVSNIIKSNLTIKAINPETGNESKKLNSDIAVKELLQLLRDNKLIK